MLKERKSLRTGASSLYLEMYRDGKRTYEFLHLYLNPGKDPVTKAKNKATLEAAKTIQARRIVAIQQGEAQILAPKPKAMLFTGYFDEYMQRHSQMGPSHRKGMATTLKRWTAYAGDKVRLKDITPDMLLGFGEYLRKEVPCEYTRKRDGGPVVETIFIKLKPNSIRTHWNRVAWVLGAASRDGLIPFNPADKIDHAAKPKTVKTERDYLDAAELKRLVATPCPDPELKRAFLFSCYTGLRRSDVFSLTRDHIHGRTLSLRMRKTKDLITIPLSDAALKYVGDTGKEGPLFVWRSQNKLRKDLTEWTKAAGISKHVTFHVARHTFATLALTYGADFYTVSKLLGHADLKTTQIYAQIVDKKKQEAVNLIPEF